MSPSFDLKAIDVFTAGTVGPPGQRVFYLQAREGSTLVTLRLEKAQVGALGDYLAGLLAKLPRADAVAGDLALLEPVTPAWVVRSLGVGHDEELDRIIVVAEELVESEEPDEEEVAPARDPASARFQVTRAQAAAFVQRARELMKAGRKPCAVCGGPLNPGGHVCPRSNGHGRD